jgi:hypothetical protein
MPQLVKGGKWVFGWVIVGRHRELVIPSEAWEEYGCQPEEEAVFLPGSRTSGGFGLSTARLLAQMAGPMQVRVLARGHIGGDGLIVVPPALGVQASGRALGFVARGPIYDEARNHPELETLRSPSLLR